MFSVVPIVETTAWTHCLHSAMLRFMNLCDNLSHSSVKA